MVLNFHATPPVTSCSPIIKIYSIHKKCEIFEYYGGHFTDFTARITAPHTGEWNIIIDAPGGKPIGALTMNVIK